MNISKASFEDLVRLGILQSHLCTEEESAKYAGMAEAGEKLPDRIYHGSDDAAQYYELSGDVDLDDVPLMLQIKMVQNLHTINVTLIFVTVILLIALIWGFTVFH